MRRWWPAPCLFAPRAGQFCERRGDERGREEHLAEEACIIVRCEGDPQPIVDCIDLPGQSRAVRPLITVTRVALRQVWLRGTMFMLALSPGISVRHAMICHTMRG